MAFTTITKSSDYFNTKLYTGNGSAGHSITGIGHQPDLVWIKQRDSRDHFLFNAVNGATKYVASNTNAALATDADTLTPFGADGFTLGSGVGCNENNDTHVAWNWKEHVNAGFDIVTWTGNGSARTIAHSLNKVPTMIMVKDLSAATDWTIYHVGVGNTKRLVLNTNNGEEDDASFFNDTSPTSSVFSIGSSSAVNLSGRNYICYAFTDIVGYSKFGSYVGNGNADGPFIYTGFKPAFVMVKPTVTDDNWVMFDNKRLGYNPDNNFSYANKTFAENDSDIIDLVSNGFKMRNSGNTSNRAEKFIYMAFGQSLVGSNNVPCTAR